jgi:hypothetical protein
MVEKGRGKARQSEKDVIGMAEEIHQGGLELALIQLGCGGAGSLVA